MTTSLAFLALAASPARFDFLDVEAVDGRQIVRFRPVELGPSPVRPLKWEGMPPTDVLYGLATVGPTPDTALAVAWAPGARLLWVDADGDGRLDAGERQALDRGSTVAVAATIVDKGTTDAPPGQVRRTLLFRPGLLGEGPRFAVRGAMSGTLTMGGHPVRVVLTDGGADGCFDNNRTDRAWVDLDGDGRFDPATEQFPLGTPISVAGTVYTIASDPWARAVAANPRDTRQGRLRLSLREGAAKVPIASLTADLVGATGEFISIRTLDEDQAVPVGRYRVAAFELQMPDASGRIWSYTFNDGRRSSILVEPDRTVEVRLLDGLSFDVVASSHGGTRPGDDVDVTPNLRLGSGLYLSNCTMKTQTASSFEHAQTAAIVLKSPGGEPLDRASSGFQ